MLSYERVSTLKLSDHRPVSAAFEVFWNKKEEEKKEYNDFEIMNKFEE